MLEVECVGSRFTMLDRDDEGDMHCLVGEVSVMRNGKEQSGSRVSNKERLDHLMLAKGVGWELNRTLCLW